MSRFRLPFQEITLSKFTSLGGRNLHDCTDYPNSLHGFISCTFQMTNTSRYRITASVFRLLLQVRNSDNSIRLERRSLDRRLQTLSPATHASLFNATIPNHKFKSFKSRASDADRSNEIAPEE